MDTGLLPLLLGGVIVALLLAALSGLRVIYHPGAIHPPA
jgi:hypothetical protein